MGKVVTINQKVRFDSELGEPVKAITRIEINGLKEDVETRITAQNEEISNYKKYNIEFYKKLNIVGRVNNRPFNAVLRKYVIPVLVNDQKHFVLSFGDSRGTLARYALRRLRKETIVKCTPVEIDLGKAIPAILHNMHNVTVHSGWFSKLGTQLRNALLQGEEVNENADWKKFLATHGSVLKNVQFKIVRDDIISEYIIISLSSRGFIYTNGKIKDSILLEIVDEIISCIDKSGIVKYEGCEESDEEDEEELYFEDDLEEELAEIDIEVFNNPAS